MNIMAHKTKEKTKENTKEKTKEIFLDCLVLKTLEFTTDITMDFGSKESLEIGNQGIDQAPRNIPWFLEAIPKEDVSWDILFFFLMAHTPKFCIKSNFCCSAKKVSK